MPLIGHDNDLGADIDSAIEVDDIIIDHADTSARDVRANCLWRVGAMNSIDRIAEINGARAQRIADAAGYESRQIRLALDHLRGRYPVRPFRFAAYGLHAGPGKPVPTNADAIADGFAATEHVIKPRVGRIDNDGTRSFVGLIGNNMPG